MSENEISGKIIDICYHVHVGLGPGLLESIYEKIIAYELTQKGLAFVQQQPIPVFWKGVKMDIGFRAALIVENKVLVELKSVEKIAAVHQKQVMSYLN